MYTVYIFIAFDILFLYFVYVVLYIFIYCFTVLEPPSQVFHTIVPNH